MPKSTTPSDWWRRVLMDDDPDLPIRWFRNLWIRLPNGPRCQFCHAPFHGAGAPLMRLMGKGPSRISAHLCQQCQTYASRQIGGAEIGLSMVFADVRGSTALAETLPPGEFSGLISRFFAVAAAALADHRALIDRFVGDQAVGYFVPGFAGEDHAAQAISAARKILAATGHGSPDGPWIPVGVGVHTGVAFVGAVGMEGQATDITALGDAPNTGARLASAARAGEILVSEDAQRAGELPTEGLEQRELELKGKSVAVRTYVLK